MRAPSLQNYFQLKAKHYKFAISGPVITRIHSCQGIFPDFFFFSSRHKCLFPINFYSNSKPNQLRLLWKCLELLGLIGKVLLLPQKILSFFSYFPACFKTDVTCTLSSRAPVTKETTPFSCILLSSLPLSFTCLSIKGK